MMLEIPGMARPRGGAALGGAGFGGGLFFRGQADERIGDTGQFLDGGLGRGAHRLERRRLAGIDRDRQIDPAILYRKTRERARPWQWCLAIGARNRLKRGK